MRSLLKCVAALMLLAVTAQAADWDLLAAKSTSPFAAASSDSFNLLAQTQTAELQQAPDESFNLLAVAPNQAEAPAGFAATLRTDGRYWWTDGDGRSWWLAQKPNEGTTLYVGTAVWRCVGGRMQRMPDLAQGTVQVQCNRGICRKIWIPD